MKKLSKYALLMVLAVISALQLGACADDAQAAIDDIVNELKKDKDFSNVEYDGKNIVITMESDDPDVEKGIQMLGADKMAEMMKAGMAQELKSGTLTAHDKKQVEALVKKDCGFQFVIKAGKEKVECEIPAQEFADMIEK